MKKNLNEQAKEIVKMAEDGGVQSNFFFLTTFKRYQVQLNLLNGLEKVIKTEGLTVEREYIKGSKSISANPAITEYNRTTDSANKTMNALLKIIKQFNVDEHAAAFDPLMNIINGGANDE